MRPCPSWRYRPSVAGGTRLCSRPGCAEPATATLTYQYDRGSVWLDPLLAERDPHDYDLCTRTPIACRCRGLAFRGSPCLRGVGAAASRRHSAPRWRPSTLPNCRSASPGARPPPAAARRCRRRVLALAPIGSVARRACGARRARLPPGVALVAWAAAFLVSNLGAVIVLAVAGYADADSDTWPIWLVAILQVPLWIGLIGAVVIVSRRWGTGSLRRDYGLRFLPIDVVGLPIGVLAQLVFVPLLYRLLPFIDRDEVSDAAESLTYRATGWGVLLLFVLVAVGRPSWRSSSSAASCCARSRPATATGSRWSARPCSSPSCTSTC